MKKKISQLLQQLLTPFKSNEMLKNKINLLKVPPHSNYAPFFLQTFITAIEWQGLAFFSMAFHLLYPNDVSFRLL